MSETFWVLIFGVPIIAWLLVRAVQRVRLLRQRIADVQDELARNPRSPYESLAELFNPPLPPADKANQERTRVQRTD